MKIEEKESEEIEKLEVSKEEEEEEVEDLTENPEKKANSNPHILKSQQPKPPQHDSLLCINSIHISCSSKLHSFHS